MRGLKISNSYVEEISDGNATGNLYEVCPKAVFAAIAISALTDGGDRIEEAKFRVVEEWWALYRAGIVAQKPPFGESINGNEP
jgi:hypothetical protein